MSQSTAAGYLAMLPRLRAEERLEAWEVLLMASHVRGRARAKWLQRLSRAITGQRRAERLDPAQRTQALQRIGIKVLPLNGGERAS